MVKHLIPRTDMMKCGATTYPAFCSLLLLEPGSEAAPGQPHPATGTESQTFLLWFNHTRARAKEDTGESHQNQIYKDDPSPFTSISPQHNVNISTPGGWMSNLNIVKIFAIFRVILTAEFHRTFVCQ